MPTLTVILLVCLFLTMDLIIVGAVLHTVGQTTRDLAAKFPARPVAPDAERRNFQSFRFGIINMGNSIHVAVDEDYLHLFPARIGRWLKFQPLSIPWDSIKYVRKKWGSVYVQAGGVDIAGPEWALGLARPSDGTPKDGSPSNA